MAKKRLRYLRCDSDKLHHADHHDRRQRRIFPCRRQQLRRKRDQQFRALTVSPGTGNSTVDVITYHYDNGRSGENLNETALAPANVNSTQFGKKGEFAVDGKVDASRCIFRRSPSTGKRRMYFMLQPSTAPSMPLTLTHQRNHIRVPLETTTLGSGENTSDNRGCGQVSPEIGITATPVIDRGRNVIYVVAMSKNSSGSYFQRLHALNLSTGAELFSGPQTITATYPGTGDNSSGGNVIFVIRNNTRTARPAADQRNDLHHVVLPLRHSSLHLVGDGLQCGYTRANQRPKFGSERQ